MRTLAAIFLSLAAALAAAVPTQRVGLPIAFVTTDALVGTVINFRKSVPFIAVFLIALVLALLAIDPPKVLWPIFVIYGLSGYAVYVWQRAKGKRVSIIPLDDADDDLHR